ncbi:carbamoyltransferase HypF [Rhodoferax aquaticus]|uniref:Carbamoyltransferase HypF n=1 Tax=Rhodoferax aquaticus TaxID=2527691 RepID=A0A515EVJ2_9BURK|nr:carbamoyltransferase HypF [Rhodoferax aquaticus]
MLALGAYLKNRACLVDGAVVHWSPLHGDLENPSARAALAASAEALAALATGPLHAVAHDLHPDFYSTQLASTWAERLQVPSAPVQHHHAHTAATAAEAGLQAAVLGIALDGYGMGHDGAAWGGELLHMRAAADGLRCERLDHLPVLKAPGGDAAAREPWRMTTAALHQAGQGALSLRQFASSVGQEKIAGVLQMLDKGSRCPPSSSAGRWFDAAAGALGLCPYQTHEAQAAMQLEALARDWMGANPSFDHNFASPHLDHWMVDLCALASQGRDAQAQGAAQFHLGLAHWLAQRAAALAQQHRLQHVALGGGCFANALLRNTLTALLSTAGLAVHSPQYASCGDEGLALGQAWVAAHAPLTLEN